jgi:hypothetical protein
MERDLERALAAWEAEQVNRGFGDAEFASGRSLQPFSRAGIAAADNLLAKAQRAVRQGDRERATRYVARAVELPFDDHEEAHPAAWQAHMALFTVVTDEAEEAAAGDHRWLDAAIQVLESAGDFARGDLRDVLADIDHDYQIAGQERRRLRQAIAQVPAGPELIDLALPPEELAVALLEVVEACVAYEEALDSLN